MSAFGSSLPVSAADRAQEPAWVRNGSASVQQEYALGQAFEQQLISEMTRQIAPGGEAGEGEAEGEGSGEGAGGATQSLVSSMVPEALAGAVATGRGLGIAEQLTRQLSERTPGASAAVPDAGGTKAATGAGVTPAGGTQA